MPLSLTILFHLISFGLFFLALLLSKKKRGLRLINEDGFVSNPAVLIQLHVCGIVLFGLFPALSAPPSSMLLYNDEIKGASVLAAAVVSIAFIVVSLRVAEKKYEATKKKMVLKTSINNDFLIVYFLIRLLFLAAYEIFFRGYLLNNSILIMGIFPAVILNIFLYSLLHYVNGKEEMLACIPFGAVLCWLCIWQDAVWPAIVIHVAMSIFFEINCTMKIKTYKKQQYENFNNRRFGLPGQ